VVYIFDDKTEYILSGIHIWRHYWIYSEWCTYLFDTSL